MHMTAIGSGYAQGECESISLDRESKLRVALSRKTDLDMSKLLTRSCQILSD